MAKKSAVFIAVIVAVITCLFCMAGCKSPYNAEIVYDGYNNSVKWINEDFIKNNYTAGANYGEVLIDYSFPKSRTFVIKSDEEKLNILNSNFDVEVNFEKEMLIVYTWTISNIRPCYINSLKLKDDILFINFYMQRGQCGRGDACVPYQRWFVIRLDLLSMSSVEIKEV